MSKESIKAAEVMDWQQVVLNGGPPCFYLGDDGIKFCSRAERWAGHSNTKTEFPYHKFVSLADLLKKP
jgi:hypothetical protein